jgi:hypothetical protein
MNLRYDKIWHRAYNWAMAYMVLAYILYTSYYVSYIQSDTAHNSLFEVLSLLLK